MSNKKTIITAALIIIAIIAAALFYFFNQPAPAPAPAPTTTATPTPTETGPAKAELPIANGYPNAPQAQTGAVSITANKNGIITVSDKQTLTLKGQTLTPATEECKATETTDFCLVARITTTAPAVDIYYLKDAVHNRLFENPKNFRAVKIPGSPSAGTLMLNLGENEAPTGVITNQNSSGWMLVVTGEQKAANEKLTTVLNGAAVTQK